MPSKYAELLEPEQKDKPKSKYAELLTPTSGQTTSSEPPAPTPEPLPAPLPTAKESLGSLLSTALEASGKAPAAAGAITGGLLTGDKGVIEQAYGDRPQDLAVPAVSSQTVTGAMKEVFPSLKLLDIVAKLYPNNQLAQNAAGVIEGIGEFGAGMTSASSLSQLLMAPVLPEGKIAQLALAGVFETQAAINLPDRWKTFQSEKDPRKKTALAVQMAGELGLPALAGIHAAFGGKAPEELSPVQRAEIEPFLKEQPTEGGETSAKRIPEDEGKIPTTGVEPAVSREEGGANLEQQTQGGADSGTGTQVETKASISDRLNAAQQELKAAKSAGDPERLTQAQSAFDQVSGEYLDAQFAPKEAAVEEANKNLTSNTDINPTREVSDSTVFHPDDTEMSKKAAESIGARYEGIVEDQGKKYIQLTSEVAGHEDTIPVQPGETLESVKSRFEEKRAQREAAETTKQTPEQLKFADQQLALSNDWTQATIPQSKIETPSIEPSAQALGVVPPGMAKTIQATQQLGSFLKSAYQSVKGIAKFDDYRKSVLNWSATHQKAVGELFKAVDEIETKVPDAVRREGITNWIQAGGDETELQNRAASTKNVELKRGYEAATKLSPEDLAIAQKIRKTYDDLLQRARAYGISINEIPDYVNQIWKRSPLPEFKPSSGRTLSASIRFAKQRYYDSFFHGEQAGLRPKTKDISKLLATYMNEVNNAIAAKQFVADMAQGTASDGRPLLASTGMVKTVEGDKGPAHLVIPRMRPDEAGDYKTVENHPALRAWRWRGQDENGNPIMVQGDLVVHPEIYNRLKNVLGQSALKEWFKSSNENPLSALGKRSVEFLVDDVNQIAKATMLGFLSPFHQAQEGTHGVGHRVNPFSDIPKINMDEPAQFDAASHGLMLLPDRVSQQYFREGLDGSRRNLVANVLGKYGGKAGETIKAWADDYQDYLFHEYIPGLKLKTYEHILPRNMERFSDQLKSGEVTEDQVKYLSAQQANAAYGHLNWSDIGRNPTIQHLLQITLLAPDFLEARGRFVAQSAKGLVSKVGHEQLAALATLAVTQYVASRAINKTLDDNYHWDEPFDMIVGNRRFSMRSVPADVYHAFSNTRQFVSGRLSPIIGRGFLEGLSGVNYRREPTTFGQTMSDVITGMIPITLQPFTRGLSETGKDNPVSPMEQFLGSMGLHVSRYSPVSKVYFLSKDWVDKHGGEYGLDKKNAVFPVSKYQQLRYALEDNNLEKAGTEAKKLMDTGKLDRKELEKRFKESLFHPFTGRKETDQIFRDSLSKSDQKIYDDALERRNILFRRFQVMPEASSENRKRNAFSIFK